MDTSAKQPYRRYVKKANYNADIATEQIIDDIKRYNENLSNHNIVFTFIEACPNIDMRISVNYIDPGEITGYHCHDFYEIVYIFKGSIIQYVNENSFTMTPGNLLFLHPSVSHSFYSDNAARAVNILIKKEYFERFISTTNSRISNCCINQIIDNESYALFIPETDTEIINFSVTSLCNTSSMNPLAKKAIGITDTNSQSGIIENLLSEQMLQFLVLILINGVKKGTILQKMMPHSRVSANTGEIISYIRENYQTITIEELSKKFGYSSTQIRRIIKNITGNNLTAIVADMRIHRTKYLLKNTDYQMSHIADIIGLDSYEHLSRMFKKYTGYTPSEYRRLNKTRIIL